MVPDCQSAAGDAVCHTVASIEDAIGSSYAEGTSHGSTDWVAHGCSTENPAGDKHVGECCSQKPAFGASSSWRPSPCAYCQS
jgi:hypothetical protein